MNIARGDVWDGVLMLVMMQVLSVACLRFGRNLERALCGCATGSLPSGAWSSALPQRVVCCCSDMAGLAVVNLLLALVWVGFLFADSHSYMKCVRLHQYIKLFTFSVFNTRLLFFFDSRSV